MRRLPYIIIVAIIAFVAFTSCGQQKKGEQQDSAKVKNTEIHNGDSTIFGICGPKSCNDSLFLAMENGDTLKVFLFTESADGVAQPETSIYGGVIPGSKLALMTYKDGEGKIIGTKVINLSTLQGRWTNDLDRDFVFEEDGKITSYIENDESPFRQWKIRNGKLVIDNTEYTIDELTSKTLSIEDTTGIYDFTRKK